MNEQEQLAKAIEIAVEAHKGQKDKSGKPYILHPLHIMNQLMYDHELATIGVLHDVVEDSNITTHYLRVLGFSNRICKALQLLTHKEWQSYDEYIEGICDNYDTIRVKRKDLEHNSYLTRLKGLTEKDFKRSIKYQKAFIKLGEAKKKFQQGE